MRTADHRPNHNTVPVLIAIPSTRQRNDLKQVLSPVGKLTTKGQARGFSQVGTRDRGGYPAAVRFVEMGQLLASQC
jgi:hypothetical protein